MDLAAFFAETAEAVRPQPEQPAKNKFPGFPVSRDAHGNGQDTEDKNISRISRISRSQNRDQVSDLSQATQARVRAGASGRARDTYANPREMREQREKPSKSCTYISRSLSIKREKEEETGNPGSLPVGDGLTHWRAGLARLDPEQPPCPDYRGGEWPRVYARALAFLDQFGLQAEALGWTASRLFGVHEAAGIIRVDACGALVLPTSGAVRAITATEVSFGHLTHRMKFGQPAGIPWWEFGR
ncbi:hypothetical protein [Methylobacterium sp. WL1]|uniref:hypothetical protein n=1 Tax=Methylobacterium sp. WL1 TaxID=2603276 RepID=UPI00164FBE7C|nr:hypothetical protein [Methylobacterium sp. WL1]